MNIGFVTDAGSLQESAEGSRFLHLARALRRRGHYAYILGRAATSPAQVPTYSPKFRFPLRNMYLRPAMYLTHLRKVMAKEDTTALVVRGGYLTNWIAPVCRGHQPPLVVDYHGPLSHELKARGSPVEALFFGVQDFFALAFADLIMTVSEGVKKMLPSSAKAPSVVLPNGVDADYFHGIEPYPRDVLEEQYEIPENAPVVGFVGSLRQWALVQDLIALPDFLQEIFVIIVGNSQPHESAASVPRGSRVVFTGKVSHRKAVSLMKAMSICVAPYAPDSIYALTPDAFSSRKLLEYAAAGRPIVVGSVVGLDRRFREGHNFLSYEPGNPRHLAHVIRQMLDDRDLVRRLSANNRKLASELSWNAMLERSRLLDSLAELAAT